MDTDEVVSEALRQSLLLPSTHRGGNSSVTRVVVDSCVLGVKSYAKRADGHMRCAKEAAALRLLDRIIPGLAPQWLGVSEDGLRNVLTWIDGRHPAWDQQSCADMIEIAARLHEEARLGARSGAMYATDSLLEYQVAQQCHVRLVAMAALDPDWVAQAVAPLLLRLANEVEDQPGIVATLSPSDFGPHNLLVSPTGTVHCIDMEFFGWDDAHKLTIDVLCHPKNGWNERARASFLAGATQVYGLKSNRLAALTPWLLLKWALIVRARALRGFANNDDTGPRTTATRYLRWAMSAISGGVDSLVVAELSEHEAAEL